MIDRQKVLDSAPDASLNDRPLITSRAHETLGLPRLKSWEPGRVISGWEFDERMSNSRGEL